MYQIEIIRMLLLGRRKGTYGQVLSPDLGWMLKDGQKKELKE